MKFPSKTFFSIVIVLNLTAGVLFGQITRVQPFVQNDRLQFDVSWKNFFNKEITGTILSGLPMDMSLHWILNDEKGEIISGERAIKIHYDVWDEIFSLQSNGAEKKFTSLDSLQTYMGLIRSIDITNTASLRHDRSYSIRLRVLIKQIGSEQDRTFWDWLNDTEESSLNENSGKEFHFSLSGLLQLFFGSGRSSSQKSGWFNSHRFKLSELSRQ